MNIQQIMIRTVPFRTFHRVESGYIYMTTPDDEIKKAMKGDLEFGEGSQLSQDDLIAEDWEFC